MSFVDDSHPVKAKQPEEEGNLGTAELSINLKKKKKGGGRSFLHPNRWQKENTESSYILS